VSCGLLFIFCRFRRTGAPCPGLASQFNCDGFYLLRDDLPLKVFLNGSSSATLDPSGTKVSLPRVTLAGNFRKRFSSIKEH
jgi:hypothetical protein